MKISSINNQYFKGHAAGQIKALYMQNPGNNRQLKIYNQMRKIGIAEGFDVFMHNGCELLNMPLNESDIKPNYWGVWSQDNKMIVNQDSKTILLTSKAQKQDEHYEASLFACNCGIKGYEAEVIFDGGNMFLGKRDNGENYLMTTPWTLYYTGAYHYLKDKNIENFGRHTFAKFNSEGTCYDKNGDVVADADEYDKNSTYWSEYAKNVICEVFDLKPENLVILPEGEYHLDLVIRPINYPYVLVNSDEKVDKYLADAKKRFSKDLYNTAALDDIQERVDWHRKNFCSTDEMVTALKNNGFIPIELPMMYGRGAINFANAIVHKNPEGLVYITNSSKPSSKIFERAQDEFEKQLLKSCPQIKKVYFVSGAPVGKDLNDIMIYLKDYKGGIHCLCCEEVEEYC